MAKKKITNGFHFSPTTMKSEPCSAKPGTCPLKLEDDTPVPHSDNIAIIDAFRDGYMKHSEIAEPLKKAPSYTDEDIPMFDMDGEVTAEAAPVVDRHWSTMLNPDGRLSRDYVLTLSEMNRKELAAEVENLSTMKSLTPAQRSRLMAAANWYKKNWINNRYGGHYEGELTWMKHPVELPPTFTKEDKVVFARSEIYRSLEWQHKVSTEPIRKKNGYGPMRLIPNRTEVEFKDFTGTTRQGTVVSPTMFDGDVSVGRVITDQGEEILSPDTVVKVVKPSKEPLDGNWREYTDYARNLAEYRKKYAADKENGLHAE